MRLGKRGWWQPPPLETVVEGAGDGSGGPTTVPSPKASEQQTKGGKEGEAKANPYLGRMWAPTAAGFAGCPGFAARVGMELILNRTMSNDPALKASVSPVGSRGQRGTAGIGDQRPKRNTSRPKKAASSTAGQEAASGSGGPTAVPRSPADTGKRAGGLWERWSYHRAHGPRECR